MVKSSDMEVRDALDRVYTDESSELDEELMRSQMASLPEEDWGYADKDISNESDEESN